ncbi:aldo/keto reductase [Streptomonospora nanhaiensis]|uniref:Aryl-alcohol dehydrogenase-like predicted oxidoreductase n=1 Tax=Streptomonospora nanhaiensis TaxID=1323731 RepID=A0A853BTX7_9ACTN|nr:aldo/keto reductase [Streptomonospora nanhaiensis]MBV2363568.1 aldo/keto reductase [Streptomonospora nanhaiensis]NYI98583.1 aryl-alcohol dehydrogenase-like predicted oxidoreductase [Streptomonospora nanhaiensis]
MRSVPLDDYRLLDRSGLRVSPLSLGTMTFGDDWGWGAAPDEARRIFDGYVDRGGNHRLNMVRSLETSLRQLGTDHVELFYLHGWDHTTPHEEVMRGLDDLVRSGEISYVGIANTPAWRIAAMQVLADLRGWSPLVALQSEYSLVQRTAEHELIPMASGMGLGVLPWSALGGGLLTGRYGRADLADRTGQDTAAGTRKGVIEGVGNLTERNIAIAEVVTEVAAEAGVSAAQVALAWTLRNPAVVSPVLGARTVHQLEDNLGALDVALTEEQVGRLDAVSDPGRIFPAAFMDLPMARGLVFGDVRVADRRV